MDIVRNHDIKTWKVSRKIERGEKGISAFKVLNEKIINTLKNIPMCMETFIGYIRA